MASASVKRVTKGTKTACPLYSNTKSKSKSKKTSKNAKKSAKDVLSNASDGLLAAGGLTNNVKKIINTIKGIGKQEPVTITWYTGHDLDNPSCWANPNWAPTVMLCSVSHRALKLNPLRVPVAQDKSFAAALTLVGWATKPKCFKFLELCSSPQKCIFVRVVDSCAGCAADSKHVDLTKAAFQSLADLDKGLLTVQMREATDPADGWLEDLWGPKMSANN
ncbi:hypothetical protein BD309DRAFT_1084937 [Dichomitus squalens]|nr:hypothetical protein BD309DRAFT_1084937 [Dichomitus squalens]